MSRPALVTVPFFSLFGILRHNFALKRSRKLLKIYFSNGRLFSFSALNVAHDSKGTRIQSIDDEMSHFVQKMSRVENTLTILFADHGNTYTEYAETIDGRFEQYHPSLFMIVPGTVQRKLGPEIMQNMRENQFKLMTVMDLHRDLITLPEISSKFAGTNYDNDDDKALTETSVKQQRQHHHHHQQQQPEKHSQNNTSQQQGTGIFGHISGGRTCDDLELTLPNFCVCQDWTMKLNNDSRNVYLVDFAVGRLNEIITKSQQQQQQQVGTKGDQNGGKITRKTCKQLVPVSFSFLTERTVRGSGNKIIAFDIEVRAGSAVEAETEKFHIEIESKAHATIYQSRSSALKLLVYDRLSLYGPVRTRYALTIEQI